MIPRVGRLIVFLNAVTSPLRVEHASEKCVRPLTDLTKEVQPKENCLT